MEISANKSLGKNKFYNVQKGKSGNKFRFILPTIMVSDKKILSWDLKMYSIFFSWLKFYYQINIFESFRDNNLEVYKENMEALLNILKSFGYSISDMHLALEFLNKNHYIVKLIKNSNLNHSYIRNIIFSYVQHQPWIKAKQ